MNLREFRDNRGKTDGPVSVWFENGALRQYGTVNHGRMIGKWTAYHSNGITDRISFYSETGFRMNDWCYFNEAGDTIKVEHYRGDTLLTVTHY
jgi:antitoxin component YwqK of YwqJK toxin-antitoxin module